MAEKREGGGGGGGRTKREGEIEQGGARERRHRGERYG